MDLTNLSYEEGLKELESIIDGLETGELTLEESFNKFKKGVDLYKHLYEILNKVEGEIKIIMEEEIEEDFQLEG
ncbi:MAG: exodeoxyribonuclease VII small subunit [Clostridiaceae bacterium]|nr:exodeoxyribonuclease VII small subunit [Clostridiaceae bacterium]MBW4859878.1 exodeoxyribonuclease VII small subunit [Clostridiaceae bacterium]MBW4869692.1 exodeoxyribonuclease VII small subunit [Clostridiaceae bacterium]